MRAALSRIVTITATDFRIRFRRTSTAVIFLLLCITAYLWIPDPSTGRAILQMDGQRALYNSPALALATATLCSIMLGLIGYYLVSNSIGRDTRSRTGFVIASTPVRNFEYLTGIFLGNLLFLSALVFGFMLSCMVMQLVRGEAPLQFASYLWHYAILLPPMIVFVSAISVLFESIRWLSGRFGDLCYFFVWIFAIALVGISAEKVRGIIWTSYLDTFSFAFTLQQVKEITHSDGLAIGATDFDASKPTFIFPGVGMAPAWILPRVVSTVYPLFFVAASLLVFNRFNPLKVKPSQLSSRASILGRLNSMVRPMTIPLFSSLHALPLQGFANSIVREVLLTFQFYPLTILLLAGFTVGSLVADIATLRTAILPAQFVAIAMMIADLPARERRAGTTAMIESLPFLKSHFIEWKIATALAICFLFNVIPFMRLFFVDPSAGISLATGSLLVACSAVGLGVASGNPKTFMVVFLMFLYLVMNDSGKTPGLDFAGWFGVATPAVQCAYLAISAGMAAVGFIVHFRGQR